MLQREFVISWIRGGNPYLFGSEWGNIWHDINMEGKGGEIRYLPRKRLVGIVSWKRKYIWVIERYIFCVREDGCHSCHCANPISRSISLSLINWRLWFECFLTRSTNQSWWTLKRNDSCTLPDWRKNHFSCLIDVSGSVGLAIMVEHGGYRLWWCMHDFDAKLNWCMHDLDVKLMHVHLWCQTVACTTLMPNWCMHHLITNWCMHDSGTKLMQAWQKEQLLYRIMGWRRHKTLVGKTGFEAIQLA